MLAWRYRNDLTRLALLFGTDKWGSHYYTPHYQRYFEPRRHERLNLLEIGVGGYHETHKGGASLRMWKAYFRNSQIVGIDLHDKTRFSEHRIDIRQCDQTDAPALQNLSREYGGFDIVIDDGSHLSAHVIKTFQVLFPLLRANGLYVVEDTQTSYWPTWGGGLDNPASTMAFFKGLIDGLNHVEYPLETYQPTYFDRHIMEIAFLHNLVVVRKGDNTEPTTYPVLIEREIHAARSDRLASADPADRFIGPSSVDGAIVSAPGE